MTRAFTKPALSLADLFTKIVSRGLQVSNLLDLKNALVNLGYYRLAGYVYPFLVPPARKIFKPETTWHHIARIYEFDRELRLLVTDAVERIEVEMLRVTAPSDDWKKGLRDLLVRFPEINPAAMGFGLPWTGPYWQL